MTKTNRAATPVDPADNAKPANDNSPAPKQPEYNREIAKWHRAMSREFAVVNENGKALIHHRVFDYSMGHYRNEWLSPDSFRTLYDHERVVVGVDDDGAPVYGRLGSAWLDWSGRRQYDQVVFVPGKEFDPDDKVLNLWRGFAVEQKEGDWSKLRNHIREAICNGDPALFDYVMSWLARCVQKPGDRGETVLVLRGAEGTGKGTLGNHFGRLFGEHYVHAARPQDLVGRFTGHLETAVFVFSDEATFAGDRRQANELKALITEAEIGVENKFRATKWVRNVTHLMFASNEDWVVPAGPEARRYVVLDVSEAHREDFDYFAAIEVQMNAGGYEAMLHELQHRDISEFNHRDIPRTQALMEQKALSFTGTMGWLYNGLQAGKLAHGTWREGELGVNKDHAYDDYLEWSRVHKEFKPDSREAWGRKLKAVFPAALEQGRPGLQERRLTAEDKNRNKVLVFPPLDACRAAFDEFMHGSMPWETPWEQIEGVHVRVAPGSCQGSSGCAEEPGREKVLD